MLKRLLVAAGLVTLAGCQKSETKVLIGATTLAGPGATPIEDSVIVVTGRTIKAIGMRKDVPIPQDSERTSLTGKWIVPIPGARLAPGEPADLLLLDRAPGGSGRPDLSGAGRRLTAGQWQPAK